MTSLDSISGWSIQTLLRGENDSKQWDEFQASFKNVQPELCKKMCCQIYIFRSVDSTPDEGNGSKDEDGRKQHSDGVDDELVDLFSEFYQPYDLTVLENLYPHVMQKSCRYMTCNLVFFK